MPEGLDITSTIAVVLALALCVLPLYVIGARNKVLALCIILPIGAALFYALLDLLGLLNS
jgi:hypothetical protein